VDVGVLQSIDEDIWMADGPEVPFFGIPYPTRMVIVRLPAGLWVWSPIALTEPLHEAVTSLGPVRWIVSPNKIHHLFIGEWLEAFDTARAYAPPGLAARRPDLAFAGELSDEATWPWSPQIDQVTIGGSALMNEVVFFHRPSSTCIVGDLIQRHEANHFRGFTRVAMHLDGLTGAEGSTPREWRATFVHRQVARQALETVLAWAPERLVIAHGECALEDGVAVLHDNLSWIARPWPV
jgi:hypothetical protein